MTAPLSPRALQLLRALSMNLKLIDEHEAIAPHDVDMIYQALAEHVRARRPLALSGGAL